MEQDTGVVVEMTEESAKKKVAEDTKEFFAIRNMEEAEMYFLTLPVKYHPILVDKLVSTAVESSEVDAQLVADFFALASSKDLCSAAAFEEGLSFIAEIIDDITIDAPKALAFFAKIIMGAGLDEDRRTNLANKSMDSDKLLALLS